MVLKKFWNENGYGMDTLMVLKIIWNGNKCTMVLWNVGTKCI